MALRGPVARLLWRVSVALVLLWRVGVAYGTHAPKKVGTDAHRPKNPTRGRVGNLR